jgi:D-alanyl-D-alanine carboxypeptidase
MRRLIALTFIVLFLSPAALASSPPLSAAGAALIDAETGTVIIDHNAGSRRLIASTTKIVTALVVLEKVSDLDKSFPVPAEAVGIEGSSVYLKAGQKVTARDLLYGLLLKSGNDAAAALAIHCSGSVEAFASEMNRMAAQLGLTNSNFKNPHGLNAENHYSSAYDLALLTRAAMKNDTFSHIVSSKYAQINGITIKNHNRMLWSYQGADGVKTGYTVKAGRCLVSSATRDGMRLIAVTLNDGNDWADHTAMLNYGFEHYTLQTVCLRDEIVAKIPVYGSGEAIVRAAGTERLFMKKHKAGDLTVEIFLPKYLWAPVVSGSRVGLITAYLDGKVMAVSPLIAEVIP